MILITIAKGLYSKHNSENVNQVNNQIIFNLFQNYFRCDSFGNRPVATSSSQNRKNVGRIRSGSTGNRPQTVNYQRQNFSQSQQSSQQVCNNLTNIINMRPILNKYFYLFPMNSKHNNNSFKRVQ